MSTLISKLASLSVGSSPGEREDSSPKGSAAPGPFPDESVRVAWLMPTLEGGDYMQPIFREVSKLLPNSVIFTGKWPGFIPGCEGTFEIKELPGFRFIRMKRDELGYERGFAWVSPAILWELLRFRPHVVVVFGFDVWTFCALTFKAFTRARIVFLWDGISAGIAYLDAPLRLRIRRTMARFFDASVSNSHAGAEYLRNVLGIPDSKLREHPYLIADIHAFGSSEDGASTLKSLRHPVFLYVGRLIAGKGVDWFLQACSILKQRGMGSFSLVIVGAGAEGDKLRQLAHDLGLDGVVQWLGGVPYDQLGAYYRDCDVFVFPTLEDVWGMVVLEAVAFGKPILCSKHAGAKEMVMEGENGFVFDPREPEKLAELMGRFIQEPELIGKLGAKSREIVAPYTPQLAANVFASAVSQIRDSRTQERPEAAAFEVK